MTPFEDFHPRCTEAVWDHYVPSETKGLHAMREKLVALAIALDADAEGLLPPLDMTRVADLSRLSTVRTARKYVAVLFDIGWLVETCHEETTQLRIDPVWLRNLPPRAARTGG